MEPSWCHTAGRLPQLADLHSVWCCKKLVEKMSSKAGLKKWCLALCNGCRVTIALRHLRDDLVVASEGDHACEVLQPISQAMEDI